MNTFQASSKLWKDKIFIGDWHRASQSLSVREPATGEELVRIDQASTSDVDKAAKLAVETQKAWAQNPCPKVGPFQEEQNAIIV
jgi:acyl-CoA reductase-like NAD-dependent aldehyde dehydrogenase